jgi:hypothetical protein
VHGALLHPSHQRSGPHFAKSAGDQEAPGGDRFKEILNR